MSSTCSDLEGFDAAPVGPLGVGVDVHLDDAIAHSLADVLEIGAAAAMEDEAHRLGALLCPNLLGDVPARLKRKETEKQCVSLRTSGLCPRWSARAAHCRAGRHLRKKKIE